MLKEQGLPVSGKKADLIERLAGAADRDDAPVEETEAASDAEEEDDFFEDDDDWDDDEDEVHVAKQKPVLDEATQEALALRAAQKKKTPSFRRTNGSDTSDCLVPDGVLLMEWTTSNVATSSIEVPSFVLDMARLHPHVVFTRPDSRKSWFTTSTIWKPSIQKPNARIGRTVGGRKRETSTLVLMNWGFVS